MSSQPTLQTYSVQDYVQWEGDWELIDGCPVAMAPSPAVEHQITSFAIAQQLGESLSDCHVTQCRAFAWVGWPADLISAGKAWGACCWGVLWIVA